MANKEYVAKIPDEKGMVEFSSEENSVWHDLYERQIILIRDRACPEFLHGLDILDLNSSEIPQVPLISDKLKSATGWAVEPVKALISFKEFFDLLANRRFPAATFIRRREDLDYLKEPDIFHEFFGHCPLLTNEPFADFTHRVGVIGQSMTQSERVMLARLYWFTVEFGLIQCAKDLKIFGGGILSSKEESVYALESPVPKRQKFDLLTVLRTSYRYDELQKNYFIVDSFEQLFSLVNEDLSAKFKEAKELGIICSEEADVRSC